MKILHIIPNLGKGGAERICLDIVRESRKRGHTVNLVVLDSLNMYEKEYPDIDPIVLNCKVNLSVFSKWDVEMTGWNKLISDSRPDVIHSHLFKSEIISRYNIESGIKYFTHCHDNMRQFANFTWRTIFDKRKLTEFYEKRYLMDRYKRCSNNFIAISADTKSYFLNSLYPTLSSRLTLLHNAIDFDSFNVSNIESASYPLRLISIGSFVPKKNQTFLVELTRRILKAGIDVKLTLLGDGPERTTVLEMINKYGLNEIITAPGNVNNVAKYLAESNVYVHGALYEPFGLVLIEAMAAGLPVLSIDGGGNKDLILEGKNGHLFKPSQIEEFCEKLIYISRQPDLYRKMSSEAIEFAKNYDIKQYVDKLLDLYAS